MTRTNIVNRLAVFLVALLGSALITGCTVTPGSHVARDWHPETVEPTEQRDIFGVPLGKKTPDAGIEARQVLITAGLTAQLSAERQTGEDIAENDPAPGITPSAFTTPFEYRIGNGDILSIVVWDHPELTAPFGSFNNIREQGNVVREDGTFYYPFVGSVQAEGRTAKEIRDELAMRLAKFIESPQLDVRVAA